MSKESGFESDKDVKTAVIPVTSKEVLLYNGVLASMSMGTILTASTRPSPNT
jgi:hypothetical protein